MEKFKFLFRYLLIPVVLIVFSVAFYLVYRDIKDRTISEFSNEQLILAKTASQGITSFFDEYLSDLSFLAQQPDIIDLSDQGKTLMEFFFRNHSDIMAATTWVNKKGIIEYTYPLNESVIGNDISYQDHVKQVMTTHKPVISDVFTAAQGYRAIAMHYPIFRNKEYTGSLAILIPIDRLGMLYLGKIKPRGDGHSWLISESGIELYCQIPGHIGKSFIEMAGNDVSAVQLYKKINTTTSGSGLSIHDFNPEKSRPDEMYITFYRVPLQTTFWTILISCREEAIYLELTRLRNRLIMIFSLFMIITAYFFYSLVKVRNVLNEESKRRKAEKTLKESEEKFRRLFEDHTAIKLIIDPETSRIMDANKSASAYYGWSQDELKTLYIKDLNTASDDEIKSNMRKVILEKKSRFEFRHRLKNGTLRDVEVFSSKIRIGDKELLHSIIHDITERKRVEKELIEAKEHAEESDRLKTSFLQNLSHEIRTPMNAIMGFSSLLVENYNNREKLENYAEIINTRCNDLLTIINDILDISKIESGQLPIVSEECSLPLLFEELTEFFTEQHYRTRKKNIEFKLKALCTLDDSVIITDKVKLRQIFINLIGNAFKYTDSGVIEGGCKYKNKQLVFYVSDTGIGIPPDKQEMIFDRFVQLHHDKNISYGGTGLGLSIVKGLVGILGGKIWLDSEPGKGTVFYFTFPFLRSKSPAVNPVSGHFMPEYHFQNRTILVVEDDPYNAKYIKEILTNTGLKILHTELGREAVKIAEKHSPDLVLLDIRLPDMSGYDAMRQMKQHYPLLRIIAQTAYAGHDDKQKAYDAGCNDYISKPLNRELLLSLINKHLWR